MFRHRKIRKLFENDDSKLVYLLRNKRLDLASAFKTNENLLERSIHYHKNTIAEAELMSYCDDINYTNDKGQSYLMVAIEYNNSYMFHKLLEKGCRLDMVDHNRESALFYALRSNNDEYYNAIIDLMEIKGFNVEGNNSALYAYLNEKKDIAIDLLEKGDYINHINKEGNTILHYSVLKNDANFAIRLLELGADVFIRNYKDQSALDIAKENQIEELLIQKMKDIFSELFENDEQETIMELLDNNADVDDYSHFNIPFLIAQYAIKYHNEEAFNRIIRNTRILGGRDYLGNTLMMYCLKYDQILLAKKILYLDVDLNVKNFDQQSAIHMLVIKILQESDETKATRYKELFNEFIECKVDLNIQDAYGNTILMYAIMGSEEILIDQLITDLSIDLNLENNEGKTALILAYEQKDFASTQKIIMSRKVDLNHMDKEHKTLLLLAMMDENMDLFEALLHYGTNLNLRYDEGETILMIALSHKKIRFVAKIFEYEFDVNIKDDLGNTALMHAIQAGSEAAVNALLKIGANKHLGNRKGNTPIYLALDLNELEIAKLLKTSEQ